MRFEETYSNRWAVKRICKQGQEHGAEITRLEYILKMLIQLLFYRETAQQGSEVPIIVCFERKSSFQKFYFSLILFLKQAMIPNRTVVLESTRCRLETILHKEVVTFIKALEVAASTAQYHAVNILI
jgi:hypothetical protein